MPTDKRERQRQNRAEKQKRAQRARRVKQFKRRVIQIVWITVIVAALVTITNMIAARNSSTTTTSGETTTVEGETTTIVETTTTSDSSALGATYEEYRSQPTACGADAPPPAEPMQFDAAADENLDPNTPVTAKIATSCGDIAIQLDPQLAPETVNSFVFLARQGYFDGTVVERIMPGFVIQAGDPTATSTGGPGYSLPDEFPAEGFAYDRGVVAMANAGQTGTTGSQFFIALGSTGLGPDYSPLGTVTDGFDTLDTIAEIPTERNATGEDSRPLETVYITSVTIDVGA